MTISTPAAISFLVATARLVLASPGAPPAEDPPAPPQPRWSASAELNLWRPALQDDIALPGAGAVEVDALNLDENELTVSPLATLTNGEWTVRLSGFIFETTGGSADPAGLTIGSVTVAPGASADAEIDYSSFDLQVTREWWSRELSDEVRLGFEAGGGLRLSDMRIEVVSGGARDTDDRLWIDAVAAARLNVELPGDLAFSVYGDFGGGVDSFTGSVGTRVLWQPEPYLGVQLGYRFLTTDLEDDGFEFDGAIAGLYLGLRVEF